MKSPTRSHCAFTGMGRRRGSPKPEDRPATVSAQPRADVSCRPREQGTSGAQVSAFVSLAPVRVARTFAINEDLHPIPRLE